MPETGWFKQQIIYFSVTEARQHKINVFDGLISCGTLLAWTAAFSIHPSRVETDRQRQRDLVSQPLLIRVRIPSWRFQCHVNLINSSQLQMPSH